MYILSAVEFHKVFTISPELYFDCVCILPEKDNSKVIKFKKMALKYCKDIYGHEFSFMVLKDSIGSIKKANANFVHIIYYSHKKHDFSFYTNIDVNENNVIELAELYRKRWGIENGYQERKIDIRGKTQSTRIKIKVFLIFLFHTGIQSMDHN